jgi:putative salt-induced outer membrane protein YdiY
MNRALPLSVVILALLASLAAAQDAAWRPPEPSPTSKDWIKLTSGEWLRGEITRFNDETLEFDSEELDELTIDWGDIAELRSPRILTYRFTGERQLTGTASMKDGVIKIMADDAVVELPRNALLKVIEGEPTEWNYWSLKASLGVVARSGNTDQSDLNAVMLIRREATSTRFDINYNGNFSELDGEQNTNNHRGNAKLDWLITKGFFATLASVELYQDKFQNINLQTTLGAGVGQFIFRRNTIDWYVGLGAGYQVTRYISVEEGTDPEESTATVIPSTSLEWDITGDIDFDVDYSARIGVPDTRNTFHHFFVLFSIEIWGAFDFDVSLTWDRTESPRPTEDGRIPERNDFRTAFGFGLDF